MKAGTLALSVQDAIAEMQTAARAGWAKLNLGLEPEAIGREGRLELTAEHIFTAFAVTKRLGREINAAIVGVLTTQEWAAIIVRDFSDQTTKSRNSSNWRRSLLGYARQFYRDVPVAEVELEQAARDHGVWTRQRWEE